MNANVESQDLKNAGLKVTLPRLKILEMLEHSPTRHLAAEEIYRRLMDGGDDIGLATVYRVLTQFEAAGLVTRHHFEGGHAVFELERGHHHDHIVCVKCGRVDEFEDETIERRQHEKAQALGYRLVEHNLIMYGECQRENCPNLKNALRKS
ncbi:MAG: ferric iron uptake transcriptional regulator [Nevskia sp.]|jgi:Fur family transcriptional regulator, ferric uptake regulator|nr:ferric iron uptake transcriptional regulator [Nevskia sp.]